MSFWCLFVMSCLDRSLVEADREGWDNMMTCLCPNATVLHGSAARHLLLSLSKRKEAWVKIHIAFAIIKSYVQMIKSSV